MPNWRTWILSWSILGWCFISAQARTRLRAQQGSYHRLRDICRMNWSYSDSGTLVLVCSFLLHSTYLIDLSSRTRSNHLFHSWAGSPRLYNKTDWASHGELVSKQYSFMVSLQVMILAPCFTFCPDFPQWCTVTMSCKGFLSWHQKPNYGLDDPGPDSWSSGSLLLCSSFPFPCRMLICCPRIRNHNSRCHSTVK